MIAWHPVHRVVVIEILECTESWKIPISSTITIITTTIPSPLSHRHYHHIITTITISSPSSPFTSTYCLSKQEVSMMRGWMHPFHIGWSSPSEMVWVGGWWWWPAYRSACPGAPCWWWMPRQPCCRPTLPQDSEECLGPDVLMMLYDDDDDVKKSLNYK